MGTQNAGSSASLESLAADAGVTLGLAGGYSGDPNDRELIWDRQTRAPVGGRDIGAGGGPGEFTMQEQAEALYGGSTGATRTFPNIKREREAEKHLYAITDEEVYVLQNRLRAGGFYPPGTDFELIAKGDRDPFTEKAWLAAIDRAAKYKNAGQDKTIWEVIDEAAGIMKKSGIRGDGAGGRQPLVTELTNPEDLKYYAQKVAVSTLGRGLKPDELNRFISSFHGSQQAAQTQAYNAGGAGGPGGAVVGAPSAEAAAQTFARQTAPAEAGAHDFVRVYDAFSKMLGGKRGRG